MSKICITITIFVMSMVLCGLTGLALAEDNQAQQILEKIDRALAPDLFTAKVQLVQTRPGEDNKVYLMSVYSRGATKTRIDFLAPAAEKGRVMLRRGEEMWMYLPSSKRPVKVAAKQDFMGTSFANGNMVRLKQSDDYTGLISGSSDSQWILDLTAKDPSVSYEKSRLWVDKKNGMPVKQEYFAASGKLLKTLEYSEVKTFGTVTRPSVMRMTSPFIKGASTLTILDFKEGVSLPESYFTVGSLR